MSVRVGWVGHFFGKIWGFLYCGRSWLGFIDSTRPGLFISIRVSVLRGRDGSLHRPVVIYHTIQSGKCWKMENGEWRMENGEDGWKSGRNETNEGEEEQEDEAPAAS